MSRSTLGTEFTTFADLAEHFGEGFAMRVRLKPAPGPATVADVIAVHDRSNRLCELIDGFLVDKAVGYRESRLALVLGVLIESFLDTVDLGIVLGADGMLRLSPDQVRIPDVSFLGWAQFPGRVQPTEQVPYLHPDLAVEVLSPGNTKAEMARKLLDYFESGTALVWYMNPIERTVRVYTSPESMTLVDESGTLEGEPVLPGFRLTIREWFARADLSHRSKESHEFDHARNRVRYAR